MVGRLALGLDIGTSNIKVVVVDEAGEQLASAGRGYPLRQPHPGWVEVDADDWWGGATEAIRAALSVAEVEPARVAAVGVSGLSGCAVPLGPTGAVLAPAPIYTDVRTAPQVAARHHLGEAIFEVSGNPLGTWSAVPKVWWWQEEAPDVAERMAALLEPSDYLVRRLTGEVQTAAPNASLNYAYDHRRQAWDLDFAGRLGLPTGVLPPITPTGGVAGRVTAEAARHTGLPAGCPVAACGNDVVALSLALGVLHAGDAFLGTGTAANLGVVTDRRVAHPGLLTVAHVAAGTSWLAGTMGACGAALQWCRDLLRPGPGDVVGAGVADGFEILSALAASCPPGAGGLLLMPYLNGRLSPTFDPHVQGTVLGVRMPTGRAELARAVMEGTAIEAFHNLQVADAAGVVAEVIRAGGGPSRSDVWNQCYADACGRPILTMRSEGNAAVGCAWMAGAAAGMWSLEDCVARFAQPAREYRPREPVHALYREMAAVHDALYPHLREAYDRLSHLAGGR